MGLPKIIQIPWHHVLANQNALKFKKGAPLKQIFNINLRICIINKTNVIITFFSGISYFWGSKDCKKYVEWVLVGCGIQLHIQRSLPIEI